MITRRTLGTGAATLAALGLAGTASSCSNGGDRTAPDGPVSLRMTVWTADESQLALFQEIADAYIEANPDSVKDVTFEAIPFEDYTTTLTTQLSGGNAPDLAWVLESNAPEFVDSGALAEIGSTLQEYEGYEYDESALALWQGEDGLYAYPFSNSPFCVFVNTDRLQEIDESDLLDTVDSGDWTFEHAMDVSARSVEKSGGAGFVVRDFGYAQWEILATVYEGFGAKAWNEDGTQCQFAEQPMVDAMTFLHQATFEDRAMPGPGDDPDFFGGDVTMTVTQISRASALDDSFAWDVLPLPAGPAKQQNVIGQGGVAVLANAQAPEVAADFLAFFTSPDNARKLAQYFPPPRTSLLNAETLADANPQFSADQLERVVVGGITDAVTKPAHKNFAEVQAAARSAMDPLWTADADVPASLEAVCAAVQPLLDA
jgi:multiple sugar transport system substrate-binding protein